MKKRIFTIWSLLMAMSMTNNAVAQDAQVREKPDLSNPDMISAPPMDPYSLSYIPEKPDDALGIISSQACVAQGGRWSSTKENLPFNDSVVVRAVGCTKGGKAVGRWMYAMDHGNNDNFYTKLDEKTSLGYVWMVDGKRSGWEVFLNKPEDFTRVLRHYEAGVLEGAAFTWNEMGALIEAKSYKTGGILDGKYEAYYECLPTLLGAYKDGKPVGEWQTFIEPGMISLKRDYNRRATAKELPDDMPEDTEAYWTEWFNGEGLKLAEGYSIAENPNDIGTRVGDIQLYMTNGNAWLKIHYDSEGNIQDEPTFDLCRPFKGAEKPDFLDYNHEDVYINCNNSEAETYRKVYFYKTGEIWKIEPKVNGMVDGEVVEYHPTKSPDSRFGELLAKYTVKRGMPDGKIQYQDREGKPYDEGCTIVRGTGHFKSWWYTGKPAEEGEYYHGDKTGKWLKWFDNGSLEMERNYQNGVPHGPVKQWFTNGVLAVEINFEGGSRHGETAFYYSDGHIALKQLYSRDRRTGQWINYTHAGQISSDTNYANENRHEAKQNLYYTDGKLMASGMSAPGFVDNIKEGRWSYYLKDGKHWYTAQYDSDNIVSAASEACSSIQGEYKIDPEKREIGCTVCAVNREMPMQMGKMREGEWQWYSENGELEKKGAIHLGHLNGNWEFYYPNGKPMLNGAYHIDKKLGVWTGYYESGQKKFSGKYDDGIESGHWQTFHDGTGTISSEGDFVAGKREGQWVWKYPKGGIKEQGSFVKGKEQGLWVSYYENGKKSGEGQYVDGVREGEWIWWREDGSEWRKAEYVKGKEQSKDKGKDK